MPQLPVDASKFAGMSEEQARTFPRRTVVGEELTAAQLTNMPKMISTDSHVMEPDELWMELPERLRKLLPNVPFRNSPPGALKADLRLQDQITDGVAAEILFPNYGMALYSVDDIELQQESFKLYNDWLHDWCSPDRKRLVGVPLISVYDIKGAVKEMHRSLDKGMRGALIWQVPDPQLPFSNTEHYDPFFAACAEAGQPVICHILTGHGYMKTGHKKNVEGIKDSTNAKTNDSANTLFDLIFYGYFERFPKLKLLLAESELGWMPFLLQQWDYYFERHRNQFPVPITRKPSELFEEHVYGTFLEDYVGTRFLSWWGKKNCMWSNDYPHFNMTFPHSRQVMARHLKGLSDEELRRYTWDNAMDLFKLDLTEANRAAA
ncbi:MAG TPA: amidohydrolase family protein [Alphaproteobacteria bacterium]|nr:amidohydrolase family protein [Alphaproteobacteria bacterium]